MVKIKKSSPITFVELPPTQFGVFNGDSSYDVYSKFGLPSRAIHVLQGVLESQGYNNVKTINPLYNGKNRKLTADNLERIFNSDALGISSIVRTSPQSITLGRMFLDSNPRGLLVFGGTDATLRAQDYLEQIPQAVISLGESEKTLLEILQNPDELEEVKGIAFKRGNQIIFTPSRPLLTSEEFGNLSHPVYDEETRRKVGKRVIETTRGCPHSCDFCAVSIINGNKYRPKPIPWVLEEIRRTNGLGNSCFYTDDNFPAIANRTIELSEAVVDSGLKIKGSAQATIKAASNPKLLRALKDMGIRTLYIGIESINDNTLASLGKPYSAKQNKEAIKIFREYEFWVHGMLMPGGDGDTPEVLEEMLNWANSNLDSVQFFPPGPFPGTPFHKRMQEEGRILTNDWSLYDGQNVLVRPKQFSPLELQEIVNRMYISFYSLKNSVRRLRKSPDRLNTAKLMIYTSLMRGISKVIDSPQSRAHLEFLRSVS